LSPGKGTSVKKPWAPKSVNRKKGEWNLEGEKLLRVPIGPFFRPIMLTRRATGADNRRKVPIGWGYRGGAARKKGATLACPKRQRQN